MELKFGEWDIDSNLLRDYFSQKRFSYYKNSMDRTRKLQATYSMSSQYGTTGIGRLSEKIKNMKTIAVKKSDFRELYDMACVTWKVRLNSALQEFVFSDSIEFPEDFVQEMKSACTVDQKPVFDKIFKQHFKLDLIERINSYSDVCGAIGTIELNINHFAHLPQEQRKSALAYHKIQNITNLFNEGWTPDWSNNRQCKYYPYFEKKSSGWVVVSCYFVSGYCFSALGSGCYYKTKELALHCGNLFLDIYSDYLGS